MHLIYNVHHTNKTNNAITRTCVKYLQQCKQHLNKKSNKSYIMQQEYVLVDSILIINSENLKKAFQAAFLDVMGNTNEIMF